MIYLDNAATTFPKPRCVTDEVVRCVRGYCGNPGRSGHKLSMLAAEKVYSAREALCTHLNFSSPENIVFTYNATYAINIALRALLKPGDRVLVSDIEHNSVIRPLEVLKEEKNIEYSIFSTDGDIGSVIRAKISDNTTAIVSTLCSNVNGRRIPLEILSKIAKEKGLKLIVDSSQSLGHEKIDFSKTPADALCAPGHKGLFGIQGCGFVLFNTSELYEPFFAGGSGTNSKSLNMPRTLPERYEPGTLSTPAIASLYAGVRFVDELGISEICYREAKTVKKIKEDLSQIKEIELYETDGALILFNIKEKESEWVCQNLDRYGVYVRGGLHCAPMVHKKLGTEERGAVRVSVSCLNGISDAENFIKIITKILAE